MILTREQYAAVEHLFHTMNSDIKNATSRQESVCILKDTIIVLHTCRALPTGMPVGQAQKRIIGGNQQYNERVINKQQALFPKCIDAFCFFSLTATRNSGAYPFVGSALALC